MPAKFTKLVFSLPELGPAQPQLVLSWTIKREKEYIFNFRPKDVFDKFPYLTVADIIESILCVYKQTLSDII